jgi:hypothetical protein
MYGQAQDLPVPFFFAGLLQNNEIDVGQFFADR